MHGQRQDLLTSAGLLFQRLVFGGFLIAHGWGKLQTLLAGDFDQFADPIGLGAGVSLVLVVFAEVVCATLVLIGLGTRFAAIPVVFAMGVAAFVVHGGDPWTMGEAARQFVAGESKSWASKEPALLFLASYLMLVLTGAGRFSLDAIVRKRKAAK